jgi:hypothetical protein
MGRVRVERARGRAALVGSVGIGAMLLAAPLHPLVPAAAAPLTARLTAAVTAAATTPFSDGSPYPGPTPVSIAASGGAIQAENFNRGPAQQAYHACTPGDQGNGATYRTDPHDIDVFTAGGGNFYIRSSSPRTSTDPLHNCPNSATLFSDYVKYSFTVTTTGWYKITAAARNGQFESRIDDVNKGLSPGVGRTWTDALLVPAVHLTAGPVHVLTIEMLGFDADLDVVYFSPTTVDVPAPRVVAAPLTKNEVVVADAVATDPRFGAVPNNPKVDNRAAIQSAINEVRFEGGGTVFLPGGVYTVKGPLTVPANVTLRGDWSSTTSASGQTILAAAVHAGALGKPFISLLGANAGLSHLSVWYPNQSFVHPSRYPPTVRSFASSVTVSDVTLFNSDQGIFYREGSTSDISTLKATCFTTCILDAGDAEYSFITNITISNQIWASAPAVVKNKPTHPADRKALHNWTSKHLTAVQLYRNDNLTAYAVTVSGALHDIVTTPNACHPACVTYGSFSKISARLERSGTSNRIMNTDLVPQARHINYQFAPSRLPARTAASDFYNVAAPPFSAVADGVTDDAGPIQAALDAAASHGGGTVYLPAGTYLVSTHLLVPAGVELRGSYSARHTAESVDGTTLLAVEGQGTPTPNTDTAFITLAPHAGVRGITVRYPNQGFGSGGYPVTPFPYTMRSLGAGTWILDVNVLNGYQIADLATYRSDGFVVNNLWATAFLSGVNAGGSSQRGWLQRTVISYGDLYQSRYRNSPHSYGLAAVRNYTSSHVVAYYLGNLNLLQSLGADSFNVQHNLVAYRTSASALGLTNSTFFACSSDSASLTGIVLTAGNHIAFIGLLAVSPYDHNGVFTVAAFKGEATVYDATLNQGGLVRQGGSLRIFSEH